MGLYNFNCDQVYSYRSLTCLMASYSHCLDNFGHDVSACTTKQFIISLTLKTMIFVCEVL